MDIKLACGDNNIGKGDILKTIDQGDENNVRTENSKLAEVETNSVCPEGESQREIVNEKDQSLKERIKSCKKIIESLKLELSEEKAKLQEESTAVLLPDSPFFDGRCCSSKMPYSNKYVSDSLTLSDGNYLGSSTVDRKLRCDDSLMEYEKQLQRYQDTLTMAQIEKKNAIRKQMLTKAYKLKLMEVENQCNIELLRVKQSLQCLEPLKIIVNKWKSDEDSSTSNINDYELIPRYPEINPISTNDVNIFTDDEKCEFVTPSENA